MQWGSELPPVVQRPLRLVSQRRPSDLAMIALRSLEGGALEMIGISGSSTKGVALTVGVHPTPGSPASFLHVFARVHE